MTLELLIIWGIVISLITFLGSWYVRRFQKPDLLVILYVTFVIISQILATKISQFDFGFAVFYVPFGNYCFFCNFSFNSDIVNEKFGRKETHLMILRAFICQVIMSLFLWMGSKMTPAFFWGLASFWNSIFSLVPKITLASWIAFLISENLDAVIYAWLKKLTKGRYLWLRNFSSSFVSMAVDSLVFITIAFYKNDYLIALIVGQIFIKWVISFIDIPFMYINRKIMGYNKIN